MREWVIWSEEHGAWWRPGCTGYTDKLKRAGRYSEADAAAIVKSANNDDRNFNELAFALPDDFGALARKETRR